MKKWGFTSIATVVWLCLSFGGTALAQTAPPPATSTPAPTATPISPCPPDWQATCEWLPQAARAYGPWLLVALLVGLLVWWLFQRFGKVAEKKVEETLEQTWRKAEQADALDDGTTRYLTAAIEDYRFVKFRGQGARARGFEPPELDQVYVSLSMEPEAEEGGPGRLSAKVTRVLNKEAGTVSIDERLIAPVNLAKASALSPKLAIVGVAGSGKSTLLQWAGLTTARSRLRQRLTDEQQVFITALGQTPAPLPVLLPLRDYNRYCRDKKLDRSAQSLLAFIGDYVAAAQIRFGMIMPITRLRHKTPSVTLCQLSQTTTQAASGLGRQPPAGRFVTGWQGGFMLIPVVIP